MTKGSILCPLLSFFLFFLLPNSVNAQQSAIEEIFKGLIAAGVSNNAMQEWTRISEKDRLCIDIFARRSNSTLEGYIQHGILPSDQRLGKTWARCNAIIDHAMRKNYSCQIGDPQNRFNTFCDDAYAVNEAGALTQMSLQEVLQASAVGRNVVIAGFERADANQRRQQMSALDGTKRDVNAPSFDCEKARTRAESFICRSHELSSIDRIYANYYQRAKAFDTRKTALNRVVSIHRIIQHCSEEECIKSQMLSGVVFLREFLHTNGVEVPAYISDKERVENETIARSNAETVSVQEANKETENERLKAALQETNRLQSQAIARNAELEQQLRQARIKSVAESHTPVESLKTVAPTAASSRRALVTDASVEQGPPYDWAPIWLLLENALSIIGTIVFMASVFGLPVVWWRLHLAQANAVAAQTKLPQLDGLELITERGALTDMKPILTPKLDRENAVVLVKRWLMTGSFAIVDSKEIDIVDAKLLRLPIYRAGISRGIEWACLWGTVDYGAYNNAKNIYHMAQRDYERAEASAKARNTHYSGSRPRSPNEYDFVSYQPREGDIWFDWKSKFMVACPMLSPFAVPLAQECISAIFERFDPPASQDYTYDIERLSTNGITASCKTDVEPIAFEMWEPVRDADFCARFEAEVDDEIVAQIKQSLPQYYRDLTWPDVFGSGNWDYAKKGWRIDARLSMPIFLATYQFNNKTYECGIDALGAGILVGQKARDVSGYFRRLVSPLREWYSTKRKDFRQKTAALEAPTIRLLEQSTPSDKHKRREPTL